MRKILLGVLMVFLLAYGVPRLVIGDGDDDPVMDEGVPLLNRSGMDFAGDLVNCVDDVGSVSSKCTIDLAGTRTWTGTAILETGVAFQFGDQTDATVTHTYGVSGANDPTFAYTDDSVTMTNAATFSVEDLTCTGCISNTDVNASAAIAGSKLATNARTQTKCGAIETPVDADTFMVFRAETALTITAVDCIVEDATSAVLTLEECNADGNSCTAIEAAMTCVVTNVAHASTIDNASIDAGDWIRIDVGAIVGTPGHTTMCFSFTTDD